MKKECYVARHQDEDYESVFAIVATSLSEAKKIGMTCLECDYIEVRLKKHKEVDVSHLPTGEIADYYWVLSKGLYGWIDDTCPRCGTREARVQYDNGFFCSDCEDSFYEKAREREKE